MVKLRRGLSDQNLGVQRWQGAGAIAEAMFKRHRTIHYSPFVATRDVSEPQEWAHYAFFGGRIELCQQGKHVGELYGYDVTSAYPAEQAALPAMVLPIYEDAFKTKPKSWDKGKWTYLEGKELDRAVIERMPPYSMIESKFDFPTKIVDDEGRFRTVPFYPLPYRTDTKAVTFPAKGWGRYHRVEALAAFEWVDVMMGYAPVDVRARALVITGAYVFEPPRDEHGELVYPYAFLKDYFEERRRIADEAVLKGYDVREKVIKLGINSAYGKMAQGVGGTKGRAPKTSNPWVAGAITAGTRAKLLRAALKAPWDVIFFATDGIHPLKELGVESPTKILGGWEKTILTAGIWAQPGVYAFSQIDRKGKVIFTGKSRGASPNSFMDEPEKPAVEGSEDEDRSGERLFDYYDRMLVPLWARGEGKLTLLQERYLTFGYAANSPENWPHVGYWLETSRTIEARSGGVKREPCHEPGRVRGVVPLIVRRNETPDDISTPHDPEWLDDLQRVETEWDRDMNAVAHGRFAEPDEGGVGIAD
jgi:hypothetical protein